MALIALFLGLGVWVFAGLAAVSMSALLLLHDMPLSQLGVIVKGTMWHSANSWELSAIPIFVWMGELLIRTNISDRMFRGLEPWADLLPGRLLHTNVIGCTIFAAVSGSSAATTATIGKITIGTLLDRGYDSRLAIGSLAGAGSLGLMIPPSIVMIVYGVLADQSIAQLFAAGLFPGLLAALFYLGYVMLRAWANPALAPRPDRRFTSMDRLRSLVDLAPVLVLIPIVIGGIYTGLATPSEAAGLGAVATLAIVVVMRQMSWRVLTESLQEAVSTTSMIVTIIVSAAFLSSAMSYLHVPATVAQGVAALHLGPYGLIAVLTVFYLVLGMFLEGNSIMVVSLPITLPLVVAQGWDPVWFGVFLVITIELAQITPPIGFNLFVIQALTGQSIWKVAASAMPFFFLLLATGAFIVAFPQIALWLPGFLWN